jgi:hypothetical protein
VVLGSADNVLARASDRITAPEWWRLVTELSPFGTNTDALLGQFTGIVVIALSDSYLAMCGEDLVALSPDVRARLRIVTRAPLDRIPSSLRANVMPYDDRLDGPNSTLRGTRGDFAARAARHFSEAVVAKNPTATAQEHASEVCHLLSDWQFPAALERVRYTDEAILELLRAHWDRVGGRSSKLLRVLRDELNVACEQGRFVGLMNRLRDERRMAA